MREEIPNRPPTAPNRDTRRVMKDQLDHAMRELLPTLFSYRIIDPYITILYIPT